MSNGISESKLLLTGLQALQKKDYTAAVEVLRPLAESGNTLAQYHIGKIFLDGTTGTKDIATGRAFLEKAASAGEVFAQRDLGIFFRRGETPDPKQAQKWLEAAARQGEPYCGVEMAVLYQNGIGVTQDLKKAAQWLRYSAERGVPGAMHELARILSGGAGVPKNLIDAYKWLALSGSDAVALARFAEENGLSQTQVKTAQTRVSKWQKGHLIPSGNSLTCRIEYLIQFLQPEEAKTNEKEFSTPVILAPGLGFSFAVAQLQAARRALWIDWEAFREQTPRERPHVVDVFWKHGRYQTDLCKDGKLVSAFVREWCQGFGIPKDF